MGLCSLASLEPRTGDYWSASLMGVRSSEHFRETYGTQVLPCKEAFSSLSYGFSGPELSLSLSFSRFPHLFRSLSFSRFFLENA